MRRQSVSLVTIQILLSLTCLTANPCFADAGDISCFRRAKESLEKVGLTAKAGEVLRREELLFLDYVDKDLGHALLSLRLTIERRLIEMAKFFGTPPRGIRNLLGFLQLHKVFSSPQVLALGRLNTCLNQAAHGLTFAAPEIRTWMIEEAPELIATLKKIQLTRI